VGGHVNIDVSAESDNPEASLAKAGQIRRAALAPSEPSARDLQVAAKAAALEAKAQQQIQKQERAVHSQTPAADNAGLTADTASASGIPHTRQLRRAIDIYHSTAGQTGLPTALAPYGTGISLTI
jgi:hypothetical protein